MARSKQKSKRRGGKTQRPARRASKLKMAESSTPGTALDTAFMKTEADVGLSSGTGSVGGEDFTLLDLTDCEAEFTFVSPGLARLSLVEAERVEPVVASQLVSTVPMLVPTLIVRGERGRLLVAAPVLRRVRQTALYSGDTHAGLMGMIYGLPRVVFAEFENGGEQESASEELVRLFDAWSGSLLVLLVAEVRGKARNAPMDDGQIIAAHEVELERPVLWHLGER